MSRSCVVRIIGLVDGMPTPFDDQYLVEYDPDEPGTDPHGLPMLATIITSPDKADAFVFDNLAEVHACWTQIARDNPVRPDGKPNRPLTAFTIITEPA